MNKENKTVLKIDGVCKSFDRLNVLNDISFDLRAGETIGVLGKSGAGKSTLFHIISGLMSPDSGEVFLHNERVTAQPGKIHYMLQKDLLLPFYKIIDNLSLPLRIAGVSKKEAYDKIEPLLETFGLEGTEKLYPHQLSGGMRQRAALLRTYIGSNGVFLFDEPFSALDAITRQSLQKWYRSISEEMNFSALVITHDIDEALYLCDRIFILDKGKFIAQFRLSKDAPDFWYSAEYINCKKEITEKLKCGE